MFFDQPRRFQKLLRLAEYHAPLRVRARHERGIRPPLNVGRSYDVPRWYLTSPEPVYCEPPSILDGFGRL